MNFHQRRAVEKSLMTEFEFNGYTYRVYLDGTVVYGDGFSWKHSGLGKLQDIRNRVASTYCYQLKSLSKESLQVYFLSKKFLQIYDKVKKGKKGK